MVKIEKYIHQISIDNCLNNKKNYHTYNNNSNFTQEQESDIHLDAKEKLHKIGLEEVEIKRKLKKIKQEKCELNHFMSNNFAGFAEELQKEQQRLVNNAQYHRDRKIKEWNETKLRLLLQKPKLIEPMDRELTEEEKKEAWDRIHTIKAIRDVHFDNDKCKPYIHPRESRPYRYEDFNLLYNADYNTGKKICTPIVWKINWAYYAIIECALHKIDLEKGRKREKDEQERKKFFEPTVGNPQQQQNVNPIPTTNTYFGNVPFFASFNPYTNTTSFEQQKFNQIQSEKEILNSKLDAIRKYLEAEKIKTLQSNPPEKKQEIENHFNNQYAEQERLYHIEIEKLNQQLSELKGKKTIREEGININEQHSEKLRRIEAGPSNSFSSKKSAIDIHNSDHIIIQKKEKDSLENVQNPFNKEIQEDINISNDNNDNNKKEDKKKDEEKIKLQNKLNELKLKYQRMKEIANKNYKVIKKQELEIKQKNKLFNLKDDDDDEQQRPPPKSIQLDPNTHQLMESWDVSSVSTKSTDDTL